jgi:hypothetical protein
MSPRLAGERSGGWGSRSLATDPGRRHDPERVREDLAGRLDVRRSVAAGRRSVRHAQLRVDTLRSRRNFWNHGASAASCARDGSFLRRPSRAYARSSRSALRPLVSLRGRNAPRLSGCRASIDGRASGCRFPRRPRTQPRRFVRPHAERPVGQTLRSHRRRATLRGQLERGRRRGQRGSGAERASTIATRAFGSIGLTRWTSKPASRVFLRSSS